MFLSSGKSGRKKSYIPYSNVKQVEAGSYFTAVLTDDGKLYSFGRNNLKQVNPYSSDAICLDRLTNIATNTIAISVGSAHIITNNTDNRSHGWGANGNKQSCYSTATTPYTDPTFRQAETNSSVILAASTTVSTIIKDNNLYGWGNNSYGQISDTNLVSAYSSASTIQLSSLAQLSHGSMHTLYRKVNGDVLASGNNSYGQVDPDNVIASVILKGKILMTGAIDVCAINGSSFILKANGDLYGWGRNYKGVVDPTTAGIVVPTPTLVMTGIKKLCKIQGDYMLVINDNNDLLGWGSNDGYQLNSASITTVTDKNNIVCSNVHSASGGLSHVVALLLDKSVRSRGSNSYGQTRPTVSLLSPWQDITIPL